MFVVRHHWIGYVPVFGLDSYNGYWCPNDDCTSKLSSFGKRAVTR